MDLSEVVKRGERLHRRMLTAQRELAGTLVSAESAGGLVRVTVTGTGQLRAVRIDSALAANIERLEEHVLEAVHAGGEAARKLAEAKLGRVELMSVW